MSYIPSGTTQRRVSRRVKRESGVDPVGYAEMFSLCGGIVAFSVSSRERHQGRKKMAWLGLLAWVPVAGGRSRIWKSWTVYGRRGRRFGMHVTDQFPYRGNSNRTSVT